MCDAIFYARFLPCVSQGCHGGVKPYPVQYAILYMRSTKQILYHWCAPAASFLPLPAKERSRRNTVDEEVTAPITLSTLFFIVRRVLCY